MLHYSSLSFLLHSHVSSSSLNLAGKENLAFFTLRGMFDSDTAGKGDLVLPVVSYCFAKQASVLLVLCLPFAKSQCCEEV